MAAPRRGDPDKRPAGVAGVLLALLFAASAPGGAGAEELPPPQVRPPERIPAAERPAGAQAGARAGTQAGTPAEAGVGAPAAIRTPGAGAGVAGAGPAEDDLPLEPPRPPPGGEEIPPGGGLFEVDRPGGVIRSFPEGERRHVLVLTGNTRLHIPAHESAGQPIPALTVKANTLVLWVDAGRFSAQQGLADLLGGLAPRPDPGPAGGPAPGPGATPIPGFLEAIYAEGAVELTYGTFAFRAWRLYLEPHRFRGLLIEPRLDGRALGVEAERGGLPLFVRARRARLVARGQAAFDDAEVSTSRAEDRIELRVRTLTVRELAEAHDEAGRERPHVLGYQDLSTQAYSARGIEVRGERLPLFWAPSAEFGLSGETQALPVRIERLRTGRRGRFGRFGFLRLRGPDAGPRKDPWFRWYVEGGGYQERGFAGGVDLEWRHQGHDHPFPGFGNVRTWVVDDGRARDSDGFAVPDPTRWRYVVESRTWLREGLFLDVEASDFSDAGMNHEFFESEDLVHKDYESYARLVWVPDAPGGLVGTLTGRWHARDFVSETTETPEAALWVQSVPLWEPAARGAPGLDLVSTTRLGYWERHAAEGSGDPRYGALRAATTTRLATAFDAGDLRLGAFAGTASAAYWERTDGGEDLGRSALEAGLTADLQLHRVYAAQGGPLALDGLRHVIDLDAGLLTVQGNRHGPEDLPAFDLTETLRDRTEVTLHMRHRLQTRGRAPDPAGPGSPYRFLGPGASGGGLRTLLDLDLDAAWYLDDRAPAGLSTPGRARAALAAEPVGRVRVAGEARWDFEVGLESAFLGAGAMGTLDGRPLAVAGGVRYLRDESLSLTLDVAWRWSPKYELRFQGRYDREDNDTFTRVLLRRFSPDHVLVFGVGERDGELELELNLEPAIGGHSAAPRGFEDSGGVDPLGVFLR